MTTARGAASGSLIIPPPAEPTADGAPRAAWAAWTAVGAATAATGLHPTGGRVTDAVMVAVAVALAGRAVRRTPIWLTVVVAGLFTAYSLGHWAVTAAGAAMTLVAAVFEYSRRATPLLAGAASTTALAFGAWLPSHGRFGASTVVGLVGGAVLVVTGLTRERSKVRRRYVYGAIFAAEIAAVLTGFALYRLVRVRDDLALVNDEMRLAVDSFSIAEPDSAATTLALAAANVRAVGERIDSPWLRGAEVVPIVAQHVRAARVLATEAAPVLQAVADATSVLRPDRLAIRDGRIDLEAIDEMETAAGEVAGELSTLRRAVDDSSTGWLVPRLRGPIEELRSDVHHADDLATGTWELFGQASAMLGEGGRRRYLVAFITPSEARGLGGFIGNYAILEADDGRVEMAAFGRSGDLIDASATRGDELRLTRPAEYVERYQRYGVGDDDKPTPPWWWQQITVSPDMPSVGEAIAELYEQSTGDALDGVISLDPDAIEALMSATGEVEVGRGIGPLGVDNVREYLLRTQYIEFTGEIPDNRVDVLDTVARTSIARMLDLGTLPSDTLRRLGDAVAERHLMVWSSRPAEQQALHRMGVSGAFALEPDDSKDSIMVVNQNGGPNKLDAFLQRTISYTGVLGDDGILRATVTVLLENDVPSLELNPEVIGSLLGEDPGVNRTVVTFYHSGPIGASTLDARPSSLLGTGIEQGWRFSEQLVRVQPFDSTTLTFDVATRIADPSRLTIELRSQPTANLDRYEVQVTTESGEMLIKSVGTLGRTAILNLDRG